MLMTGFGGKVADADLDAAAGARWPHVGDDSLADKPGEMTLAVPRDPGGFWEVDDAIGLGNESGVDLGGSPLEGAGGRLGAEGVTQLGGFGADVGDGLANGARFITHEKAHPPQIVYLRGVFVPVADYGLPWSRKSRGQADSVPQALCTTTPQKAPLVPQKRPSGASKLVVLLFRAMSRLVGLIGLQGDAAEGPTHASTFSIGRVFLYNLAFVPELRALAAS